LYVLNNAVIYDIINLPLITNFIILQQSNIAVFKYDDVKKNGTTHSSYMLLTTKHSTQTSDKYRYSNVKIPP